MTVKPSISQLRISLRTHISAYPTSTTRFYATRSGNVSPLAHLPKRPGNSKWINWKTTALFFILGSYLSYNETLFNYYEKYTHIDENDPQNKFLPLKLEHQLKNLAIYQKLSHPKHAHQWFKLLSWENLDRNLLDNQNGNKATSSSTNSGEAGLKTNDGDDEFRASAKIKTQQEYHTPELTNHTLQKPGGILIKPIIFHNIATDEGVAIVHCGYRLCGYPFIVHGGIIATLLNETFKRNASLNQHTKSNLKDDYMVENLTINYKRPTFANQFLIVKTKVKEGGKLDKRTVELESTLENKDGKVLVKSTALLRDTGRATRQSEEAEAKRNKKWWSW